MDQAQESTRGESRDTQFRNGGGLPFDAWTRVIEMVEHPLQLSTASSFINDAINSTFQEWLLTVRMERRRAHMPERPITHIQIKGFLNAKPSWNIDLLYSRYSGTLTHVMFHHSKYLMEDYIANLGPLCPKLNLVWMSNYQLVTDSSLSKMKCCRQLMHLHIAGCKNLTQSSLIEIAQNCRMLKTVNLGYCRITDEVVGSFVRNCPDLRSLSVAACATLSNEALKEIAQYCTNLTQLNISYVRAATDDVIIQIISNNRSLTDLNVSNCKLLTGASISLVPIKCPNVTALGVKYLVSLEDDCVKLLASSLPNLRSLDVSVCKTLTDESMKVVAESCARLTSLDMSYCRCISDATATRLSQCCPELQCLKFDACRDVSDTGLYSLSHLTNLTELSIAHCRRVTDQGIERVSHLFGKLISLNISGCTAITDDGITLIARTATSLLVFELTMIGITDYSLYAISDGLTSLKSLNISHCTHVTSTGLVKLAKTHRLAQIDVTDIQIDQETMDVLRDSIPRVIVRNPSGAGA